MYTSIRTEVQKKSPNAQKAFHVAVELGRMAARRRREGKTVPIHIRLMVALANRLFAASGCETRACGRMRQAGPLLPSTNRSSSRTRNVIALPRAAPVQMYTP